MIKPRKTHSVIEPKISWGTKNWVDRLGREVDEKSIVIYSLLSNVDCRKYLRIRRVGILMQFYEETTTSSGLSYEKGSQ